MMEDLKNNNEKMKYIALVLLETQNHATGVKTYDETILSVEASSEQEARQQAEKYGKSCESDYENGFGEAISVRFLQIVDINSYLREQYEENVLELYSRHFEDLESYQKFERLF